MSVRMPSKRNRSNETDGEYGIEGEVANKSKVKSTDTPINPTQVGHN